MLCSETLHLLTIRLDTVILLDDIKARTAGLPPVEVGMTHDESLGMAAVQLGKQPPQRILLLHGACVLGSAAVTCQSAHIAHSDAVAVVSLAVRPCHALLTSALYGAVGGDYVVVAATIPSKGAVIAVDVTHSELTALAVGGAVNDNKCDISHTIRCLMKGDIFLLIDDNKDNLYNIFMVYACKPKKVVISCPC